MSDDEKPPSPTDYEASPAERASEESVKPADLESEGKPTDKQNVDAEEEESKGKEGGSKPEEGE